MALSNNNFSSDESDTSFAKAKKRRKTTRLSSSEDFSIDSSSETPPIYGFSQRRHSISTSTEGEDELNHNVNRTTSNNATTSDTTWFDPIRNQPRFESSIEGPGFKKLNQNCETLEDIYSLFLNDEIFDIIVLETNRYADETLLEKKSLRLDKWIPTDKQEIKKRFGLIMWMGLVKLPEIHLYWSKDMLKAFHLL